MALLDFKILPGVDKQNTTKGAENRWVDSNNVRFRYGLPEKTGGWASLLTDSIVGVVRSQHPFLDITGNRYIALGTDKFLLLYFEGQLFDISPFNTDLQQTSATIATTNGSTVITVTTGSAHSLAAEDIIELDAVTLPSGTGLSAANFENKVFMVNLVPSATTFTITSSAAATASISTGGSTTVNIYAKIGPQKQTYGYGWGVGPWGGNLSTALTNTLSSGINDSVTTIPVTSNSGFPTAGTLAIGNELITYTGKGTNT